MTIGIIYIATGPYIEFLTDFYDSAEKNFIPEAEKKYFVFTDREHPYLSKPNIVVIPQHQEYWPYVALHKFHYILEAQHLYKDIDYLIVFNANLIFLEKISPEEFLPTEKDNWLVGVRHPMQNFKLEKERPFENRQESTAFVPLEKRDVYFQSAIFGGRRPEFLEMCYTLRNNVEIDLAKNIIAIWHDESQVNSYFYNYKFPKVLSSDYLYPEGKNLPYKMKILMLDKSKKGGGIFGYYRKYKNNTDDIKNFQYYRRNIISYFIKISKYIKIKKT